MANRFISMFGMTFGSTISMAVLVVAAIAYPPRGIEVDHYVDLAGMLNDAFGRWGVILVGISLVISCLGASLEISLELAYMVAQTFGWNWGENHRPRNEARFSCIYTLAVIVGMVLVATGVDPLKMTIFSMVLTAATLPVAVVPFLFLMNDPHYVGSHRNSWLSNWLVMAIIALSCLLAIVSLPLEIVGGG
jgi:Mn2+/Fe2+ NRAMP family transporter